MHKKLFSKTGKLYIDQSTSAKYKRSKSLFCIEIDNLHRYTLFESGTMAAVSQINAKVFLLNLCSLRSTSKHLQASEELRILFRLGLIQIPYILECSCPMDIFLQVAIYKNQAYSF